MLNMDELFNGRHSDREVIIVCHPLPLRPVKSSVQAQLIWSLFL